MKIVYFAIWPDWEFFNEKYYLKYYSARAALFVKMDGLENSH